jgi:hypothetical protein
MGLWIDHRKAVVVAIPDDGGETTLTILSKVERQPSRSARKRSTTSYESQRVPADDRRQRRFTGQLDIYYDAVIACVRHAETILICGPGEAKGEFRKRIKRAGVRGHIEEAETAGRMTDGQIAARVRRHFLGRARDHPAGERGREPGTGVPVSASPQMTRRNRKRTSRARSCPVSSQPEGV